MSDTTATDGAKGAARAIGDPDALTLLTALVASRPTNLEDPPARRYEKPNYARTVETINRWARRFGLETRVFDPLVDGPPDPELRGIPRPNAVIDLDVGAPETVLLLAHYDVVPVPAEQLERWKSPPFTLTERADGRLYGRGSNDDLGSGVVASLLALKRLAALPSSPRNVRLLVCCDEETGGHGGVEAMKRHDAALPSDDPGRFLRGDVALIPDGSPHATAASSGLLFVDAGFTAPAPLDAVVRYGEALQGFHEVVRNWKSVYPSPDWPDHGAPEPILTGRATLTRWDLKDVEPSTRPRLVAAHAENDAPNQIAEAVTLVFDGPAGELEQLRTKLGGLVRPPFRLRSGGTTALEPRPGTLALQVVGKSAHGGYPHRGHNPVPEALRLVREALALGLLDGRAAGRADFAVDLRLLPEMTLEDGKARFLAIVDPWAREHGPGTTVDIPETRGRGGYALPLDHPAVRKLERLLADTFGAHGVFGEYGGTDASSLVGVRTPKSEPLPALVFGSMDRAAQIHDAEESVEPAAIARVAETIRRFVTEP